MHKPPLPEDAFADESLDEYCERLAAAFENLRSTAIAGGADSDDSLDEYLNRLSEAFARLADPLRNFDTPVAPPVPLTAAVHTAPSSNESPLPSPPLIASPELPPPSSPTRRAPSTNVSGRARVRRASGRKRSIRVTKRTRRTGDSSRRTPKRRKGR